MIGLIISALVSVELFAKAFGKTGSYTDEANCVIQTSDGGFVLAGRTNGFGAGGTDFLVIKLDAYGNRVWAKTFGGGSGDQAYSVIQTSDGGYAVAGDLSTTSSQYDFLVLKLSSDGSYQWARTFGGSYSDQPYLIIQTSDGGYAVGGYVRNASGYSDFLLLKLDPSGNMEWWKAYGGPNTEILFSLIQTSDRGYAMAGYTYSYGTGGGEDILVIKLDASGDTVQWARTFGGSYGDRAYAIIQTSDGGYAVGGYVMNASGRSDFLLLKLDPSGNMEWWKAYGGANDEYLYSLIQTSDGGYGVAGFTASFGSGNQDYLIVKLNASGDTLWTRTFGTSSADQARSIIQTSDGGYAVAGLASATSGYDALLIKISEEGNYPGCPSLRSWAIPSSSYTLNTSSPTPTANSFTLSFSDYNPTVTNPTPTITDLCTPLYEGTDEHTGGGKGYGVVCVVRRGGAIFISPKEIPLKVYASDGSLIYSSHLRRGRNWISMETGVYFWRAGTEGGRAVVR